jgi:hypothetical protein
MKVMQMKKIGIYGILALFLIFSAAALTIESPEDVIYVTTEVPVDIPLTITSNTTFDSISYQINNESSVLACENCSSVNDNLNLLEGDYLLLVQGLLGNDTTKQTVSFTVELEINETPNNETPDNETNTTDFSLTVVNPLDTTYNTLEIPLDITSDQTLEQISYILNSNNETIACENCSSYSTTLTVDEGTHTLTIKGLLEQVEKEVVVEFEVELPVINDTINDTDENETDGEPRFSLGFNKLPKALMNDEINDQELAAIINSNNLNPGIINRLIRTGKLGELSQQAIIDTQFNPPGIFRKLLGLIGFKHKSHSELLYENYNASETTQQKMLARDDLPEEYANEIKKNFQKRLEKRLEQQEKKQTEAKTKKRIKIEKNVYKAGKQNGKKASSATGKGKDKNNKGLGNKITGKATSRGNSGGGKSSGGNGKGKK